MNILVLNSGSSSLKYKFFSGESVKAHGVVERIGLQSGLAKITHERIGHEKTGSERYENEEEIPNHQKALQLVLELMTDSKYGVIRDLKAINGIGHRVLHGGEFFKESVIVNEQVLLQLEDLRDLGPLHMPANIMGIVACKELMPEVPQVAVFDTAFHQTMPRKSFLYALPYELYQKHRVRRYGFHGTSHRYLAGKAAEFLNKPIDTLKMVTIHLGNGSSMAAIGGGKVVDTTMGLTPLEGLVMGTRSGDLDPAIVPFLCQTLDLTPAEVDNYLNKKCGFFGMTGFSDMRDVQKARREGNRQAEDAYQVFLYRIVKYVGAYLAALKGLDVIIFSAGIGENDTKVRADICRELEFMGVKMDYDKNDDLRGKEAILNTPDSKVSILLLPTNEELVIARDTVALIDK